MKNSRTWKLGLPVALGAPLAALVWMKRGEAKAPDLPEVPASTMTDRPDAPGTFDEALARQLHADQLDSEPLLFDPHALLVRKPGVRSIWNWKEHPRGSFRGWTNDLGFNEAEPTRFTAPDVRILVAGDSHTQGVVDVDESYANVLEGLLGAANASRSVDVLNAGVPYTGPRCYLGMLQRCLELGLRPDVFVAALFIGNDFHDELRLDRAIRAAPDVDVPEGYFDRLLAASSEAPGPVAQGFNQLYRYKYFPEEMDEALRLAVDSYARMNSLCDAQGILLVALVLPTKMDVDLGDDRELVIRLQHELGLSDEEMGANLVLKERFVSAMKERGILCVDPIEAMRAADTPFFWRRDYHLNVAGHELVARRLNEALAGRL